MLIAPVVTATAAALDYTENDPATAIDPDLAVTDADSTDLQGATVAIGDFVFGQDVLSFQDQAGITGVYDPDTGVLTLSGTATVGEYEVALRTVKYSNTSDDPSTATRTITFTVDDGTNDGSDERQVEITATNDPPVVTVTTGAAAYSENAPPVAIDPTLTVTDVDSPTLTGATVTIFGGPTDGQDQLDVVDQFGLTHTYEASSGKLTISGVATLAQYQALLRTVTYANTSDNPNTASRLVTFIVNDGFDLDGETRALNVTASNDDPTISKNEVLTLNKGATETITNSLLAASDPDNLATELTFTLTSIPVNGELRLDGNALAIGETFTQDDVDNNRLTYQHDGTETASDAFEFTVADGAGGAIGATTFNITITLANIAPTVTTTAGPATYTELDAATVIDAGLTLADVDNSEFTGATVSITNGFSAEHDVLGFQDQPGISGNYNPETGVLTLTGTATIGDYQTALRSVTYFNSSANPSTATRTIMFAVHDGTDEGSETRQVEITATNDEPTISKNDGLTLNEGATATITSSLLAVSDPDNLATELTYTLTSIPANGDLRLNGNALAIGETFTQADINNNLLTYQHDGGETTSDAFEFEVADGAGGAIGATTFNITIAAVNDAPTVTMTSGAVEYTEGDSATVIDAGLTISDPDSSSIVGATVTIGNVVSGQDVLAFSSQAGIVGAFNPDNGVLTFTGDATPAAYQALLRSVTYVNSSNNPNTTPRTITFAVNDGTNVGSGVRTVNVTATNNAPTVTPTQSTTGYVEDNPGVAVDPGLVLTDPDSTTLVGATVSITNNFQTNQDELLFVDQGGITGVYNQQTGVLTLTGSASLATYQAALRSVKYRNTSNSPNTALRTIAFEVDDGFDTGSGSHFVSVTTVNDRPVVTVSSGSVAYAENDPATVVDPNISLSDADDTMLVSAFVQITGNFDKNQDVLDFTAQGGVTGSYSASTGILSLSGLASLSTYQAVLRSVTYRNTSHNPSTATRTITFTVDDGGLTGVGTRTVAITAVNDAPVITTSSGSLLYAVASPATAIDPGLTVSDVDNAALVGATVTISTNHRAGEDVLEFTNQAGLVGSFNPATGVLTISGSSFVENYQAALASVRYRNTSNTPSTDTRIITFQIDDGGPQGTNLASATRNVSVSATNATPVVTTSSSALAYTENDPATIIDSGLTLTDADSVNLAGATVRISPGFANGQDLLQFTAQSGITGSYDGTTGVLTLSGAASPAAYQAALRSVRYFNSSENPSTVARTITFTVNDGFSSASAIRVISLTAVNDPPAIATTSGPLAYRANDPATAVDSGLTLTDADSTNLIGATVSITGGFVAGQDVLQFTNQSGITGSYNAATGVLTLTGSATVGAYQAALRSVTYRNTSGSPNTAARTVTFQVNDGGPAGTNIASATRNITVSASTSSQDAERQYIAGLYSRLLGRAASQSEIDAWFAFMQAGRTRADLVNAIRMSAEGLRNTVNGLYEQFLNRSGEDEGLGYWVGRLSGGELLQVILAGFVNSPEYFRLNGNAVASFVDAAYQDLTGGAPDSASKAFWVSRLTPTGSHLDLIFQLQSSADFRRAAVEQVYNEFLSRGVEDEALEFWRFQLAALSGNPLDFLDRFTLSLLTTDEFFSRFGT